jgi:hypothetical protein
MYINCNSVSSAQNNIGKIGRPLSHTFTNDDYDNDDVVDDDDNDNNNNLHFSFTHENLIAPEAL